MDQSLTLCSNDSGFPLIHTQLLAAWHCEVKASPAVPINRKCHSHQRFLPPNVNERSQNWDQCTRHLQWRLLRSWGKARSKVIKETGDAYERNECSGPRGLHLPKHRMLNSLTWYLILEVQTACFLCCKLLYSLTSPAASLEQFSQSY